LRVTSRGLGDVYKRQENTEPYEALKRRLDDFQKDANYKNLQDNFTELNKAKHFLLSVLPEIHNEIKSAFTTRDEYINKRNLISKEIRKITQDAGNDSQNIKSRGISAEQILNKLNSLKSDKNGKRSNITYYENLKSQDKDKLAPLEAKKSKIIIDSKDSRLVESIAEDYITLFVKTISILNKEAYKKFINNLQEESNRLYSLYLGGKPQGKISIDNGIRILDFKTDELLTNLNTAELVAQKLAVANSFLSLSEKVKNKIYPIVADAPTSDFDPINTINLTMNIGKSFEQMIIMSKDYILLNERDRDSLIKDAGVVKFYELNNDKIDKNGSDSRVNKKTYVNIIK
jgi:DNA sulfur modification protein DndD